MKGTGNESKKKRKITASKAKVRVSLTALIAAAAVFVIMLQIEKSVLSRYEKGIVYMAAVPIPKGQLITEDNYQQYFAARELDVGCIPDTALKMPDRVYGLVAVFDVELGVLLTTGMFESLEDILKDMEEPVVAGFKAEDMYQVAGGTLRAGDRIHIYSITDEEGILAWEGVYVQQVFDASGKSIPNGDKLTAAQRVNIYLDKRDVETFYKGLADGSLRVVKMCR